MSFSKFDFITITNAPKRANIMGVCVVSLTLLVMLLSSCYPSMPQTPVEPDIFTVLEPTLLYKTEGDSLWAAGDSEHCISPDGRHLLTAILGKEEESLAVVPLDEIVPGGSPPSPITLYSMSTSWTKHNLVQWLTVGWLSDEEYVFIVHGWQNQGEHEGQRGTSVMKGSLSEDHPSLVAFLESPEPGEMVDEFFLTETGRMVMRISQKIWILDLKSGEPRLLRDDFPGYGPLFRLAISPKGDFAVYNLNEKDRRGIFIMDLATGEERPLLPAGETYSFYPTWSPDGRYISAYTANLRGEVSDETLASYVMIPGEDGPMPAAETVTVVDSQGNVIKSILLDGESLEAGNLHGINAEGQTVHHFLFSFAWLADSKHLTYVSVPAALGKWGEVRSMNYSGIWMCDVTSGEGPVKCGDLKVVEESMGEPILYIYPVASLPDGLGALFNIGGQDGSSVWRTAKGGPFDKVADGWWQWPRLKPYFLDCVVGVVRQDSEERLWLVGPARAWVFGEKASNVLGIVAYNDEVLVVTDHDFWAGDNTVSIYKMLKEVSETQQ